MNANQPLPPISPARLRELLLNIHADRILLRILPGCTTLELRCGSPFILSMYSWTEHKSLAYITFDPTVAPDALEERLRAAPALTTAWPDGSAETLLALARVYQDAANHPCLMSGPFEDSSFLLAHLQDGILRPCRLTPAEKGVLLQLDDGAILPPDDPAIRDVTINEMRDVQIAGAWLRVLLRGRHYVQLEGDPLVNYADIGLKPVPPYDGGGWEAHVRQAEAARVLRRSVMTELLLLHAL